MATSKAKFYRNAVMVTLPATEESLILMPTRDSVPLLFGTFRSYGCASNLTQLITDYSATNDPFEALVLIGATATCRFSPPTYSGSEQLKTVPIEGTVVGYDKKDSTVILALINGDVEEVSIGSLNISPLFGKIAFSAFAQAIRSGGSPLLVERVEGESDGSYAYAMPTDGFQLTYDIDLMETSGQYLANISASAVLKLPSCVDLTADVEIISMDYQLPREQSTTKDNNRELMSPRGVNTLAFSSKAMVSEEIDSNLDAMSIKGGEQTLTGNRRKKYFLGCIGEGGLKATFTQRLVLPIDFGREGSRQKRSPDSSVTVEIPNEGPKAVKLPQGQATVTLGDTMVGTAQIDATYPGQSIVLALLRNEALEGEVSVESVGRNFTVVGDNGKVTLTKTIRSNINLTLKSPGLRPEAPPTIFQVVLPSLPKDALVSGDVGNCTINQDNQRIEINGTIAGREEITVSLVVVFKERGFEFKLDSDRDQETFMRIVLENEAAFSTEFKAQVDALQFAIATKAKASKQLTDLQTTKIRLEQERSSAIDNLLKLTQLNSVSSARDQRNCDVLTTHLDLLDVQVSEAKVASAKALEALNHVVKSFLNVVGQEVSCSN